MRKSDPNYRSKLRGTIGVCRVCGEELAPTSKVRCKSHLAESNRTSRKLKKANVAAGNCYDCNLPREPGNDVRCNTCKKKRSEANKAARHLAAANGFCGRCKKRPTGGKYKICLVCRKSNQLSQQRLKGVIEWNATAHIMFAMVSLSLILTIHHQAASRFSSVLL